MSHVFHTYTQAELDAQYNLRARHPEHESFFAWYAAESARVRSQLAHRADLAYGEGPLATLDAFPAEKAGAPLHVFIHGGYWQFMDKASFSFPAQTFVGAGAAFVSVNYPLAPAVGMDTIVSKCREAIAWCHRNAASLNADPERIHISGHSAGGHLTGMLMTSGWEATHGLPAGVIRSGCAISGLFDLEPIRLCYMNAVLSLDPESSRRNSPLYHLPPQAGPLIAAVGGEETGEFLRQNRDFAAAWQGAGLTGEELVLPGLNHFNVVQELLYPQTALSRAMLNQMGL